MTRLTSAWRALDGEQRLAAVAALGLLLTMFLPWYGLQSLDRKTGVIHSHDINAFGDVSFVEAAIFLVAAGVLAMLFARGDGRDFELPGGDGTIVMIAGGWAAFLIFFRVFSRPAGHGYPVGIQWGFFLAFVAAGALGYAGWRMRAGAHHPPPTTRSRRDRQRTRRAHAETASDFDAPPPAPEDEPTERIAREPAPASARRSPATVAARERAARRAPLPPAPPAPPEQLSFEDPPARGD
jgi:hypothetical protein